MDTFRLTMLPAGDGDCLILTWGDDERRRHAVIDGGRVSAHQHLHRHLARIAEAGEELELYVLTHIDADHIEGALALLESRNRPLVPKRIWFNGFRQIRQGDTRSMRQGDDYSKALDKLGWPLNEGFKRGVVSIETAPPSIDVAGLRISILSPDAAHLAALGERWDEWRRQDEERKRCEEAEDRDGTRGRRRERPPVPHPLIVEDLVADGETDRELPNGSSIAFVAEWRGKRLLLAGDAHPDLLAASLAELAARDGGRYRLNLLKAPHHGSAKNMSRELISLIDCRQLAISTNGKIHGHPDPQAVARFIHFGTIGRKHLHFNYRTDRTLPWDAEEVRGRHDYEVHFPTEVDGELEIEIS